MKKFKGLFIALFAIILLIVVLWVIKTPIIASYLSNKLKTEVSMTSIAISAKKMEIKNFRLKNPPKMKERYAFQAKKIEINYSFSKLFSAPSIIDTVTVDDISLDIECSNPLCTKNNWTTIIDTINAREKKSVSKKEVLIKSLVFNSMDVEIMGLGLDFTKTKKSHVDQITFKDVSSKTGFPTQQLIAAIFRSAGLKEYLQGILEQKNFWENVIKGFTNVSDNSFEEGLKAL